MTSHYLVVGGTGMLSGVVKALIKDGNIVSIVSRGDEKFRKLVKDLGTNNLYHLSCDYHDIENLKIQLKNHTENLGFFDVSICWVHEP
ncbi:short chain dehydrogenase [Rahnella aquatilis HX2]|nr:short chain dehydrogenase [Rahnella aquatilis HX2]